VTGRLIRWFTYTVAFALLPLATTLALRYVHGSLSLRAVEDSPEILFFALMVCAVALGDIHEFRSAVRPDALIHATASALLLGVCASAILYGSFVYDKIMAGGNPTFQHRLLYVSIGLASVFLVAGTVLQVFIGRVEGSSRVD
jgi:hypothetical protein